MSTTYTGSAASGNALPFTFGAITIPVDGDALTASSVVVALQKIADQLQLLQGRTIWNNYNNVAPSAGLAGVYGTGNTTGAGFDGTGGSSGPGVKGTAVGASQPGVLGQGGSGGVGGSFTGGSGGSGVFGQGVGAAYGGDFSGGTGAAGIRAARSDGLTTLPAAVVNGTIDIDGSVAPVSTTAIKNKVSRMNIAKAGASVTLNNTASPVVGSAHNLTSVAQNTGTGIITVTFAQAMATTDYSIVLYREFWPTAAHGFLPSISSKSTTGFTLVFWDNTGAGLGAASGSTTRFNFEVFGDQ